MTKQTWRNFATSLALLGVVLSASLSSAQSGLKLRLPGKRPPSSAMRATSAQTQTPGPPSYSYTLFNFPGTLYTFAEGINLGAATARTEIVGGYGPDVEITPAGFLAQVSGTKIVTESYEAVNASHVPAQQAAFGINDSGQIVGSYLDSSGLYHGYEKIGGRFTELNVSFAGASNTIPSGINNSGEIVGGYTTASGSTSGFFLVGGVYTSFNYPEAIFTNPFGVNSAGDIVGQYTDSSGVGHGFLLSGGTYTSFDFPGAVDTFAAGINDAGEIVGVYCLTGECIPYFDGAQGFVLSGGVYTTIAVPGEVYSEALGINNNGVIVGFYQDAAGLAVSFLATP